MDLSHAMLAVSSTQSSVTAPSPFSVGHRPSLGGSIIVAITASTQSCHSGVCIWEGRGWALCRGGQRSMYVLAGWGRAGPGKVKELLAFLAMVRWRRK